MTNSTSAIFLDRDGTINYDYSYVYKIDNFKFIKGAINAMFELKKMGYILIQVTNQSGIARGLFTESQFITLTKWINYFLVNYGVNFDATYYCPHYPNAVKQQYKQICNCRKPNTGMLLAAQRKFNINMKTSYMIGDKFSDMQAGKKAHIGTNVLISATVKSISKDYNKYIDWIVNSLSDLPNKIKIKANK